MEIDIWCQIVLKIESNGFVFVHVTYQDYLRYGIIDLAHVIRINGE